MNRKLQITLCFIFVVAVVLFVPFRRVTIAPAVQVRILDESGNPAKDVLVVEDWEYRSIGSHEAQASVRSDQDGYAGFPRRSERLSFANQLLSVGREILYLPHGYGIGPYVRVMAYGADPYV